MLSWRIAERESGVSPIITYDRCNIVGCSKVCIVDCEWAQKGITTCLFTVEKIKTKWEYEKIWEIYTEPGSVIFVFAVTEHSGSLKSFQQGRKDKVIYTCWLISQIWLSAQEKFFCSDPFVRLRRPVYYSDTEINEKCSYVYTALI